MGDAPAASRSTFKGIIIGAAVVAIIAAGAAAAFIFLKGDDSSTAAQAAPAPPAPIPAVWPMDPFIVNIADTNGERFLKIVLQLEVSDQAVVPDLEQLKPRLRDTILDLLTSKTHQDLMDLSGKQRLREEIAGRVNTIITKGRVTRVFITDFVVQ